MHTKVRYFVYYGRNISFQRKSGKIKKYSTVITITCIILVPPPWLIAMQRYGPPPSYPNLKIPGLNAPIPDGCSFGYHAGGWGKPPVDETGKPLYGDVFGTADAAYAQQMTPEEIDTTLWGEMESESEEEVLQILSILYKKYLNLHDDY